MADHIEAIDGSTVMDIGRAFEIVLELARENIAHQDDVPIWISKEQEEACDIIEDLATNQFGDD